MKIGARKCDVVEISQEEATTFLINYHRQKSVASVYNIGLKYNNELVGLMTFGYPRYNIRYQWELLRLCFKAEYRITGGTQKLFDYFVNTYNPHSIVSYCDYNYFTGDIYDKLGFTKIRVTKGSKIWYKDDKFITDNLLRQYGADKLIGTHDGKGTDNEEIMLREGWQYKLDEKGQGTYIWNGKGKFGYIYLITDTLHNKQYIGQHRGYKLDENYYGSGRIIKDLIKAHGTAILKREIIDYADSQEDLSKKEITYIQQYNTLWPNGYNLTLREQAIEPYIKNVEMSEETRQKLSKASKRMWQNEEYRKKISITRHKTALDPEYIKRLTINITKAWNDPKLKKEASIRTKEKWQDERYRKTVNAAQKKAFKNPEIREKVSNGLKNAWQDEVYRTKMLDIRKKQVTTKTREKMTNVRLGRHWYNNGKISIFQYSKPEGEGWQEGRLYKRKNK